MDLTTKYLGIPLRTPLLPSASPLSEEIDNIKRMEDASASAVVLYSLFEEQLLLDRYELHHHLTQGIVSHALSVCSDTPSGSTTVSFTISSAQNCGMVCIVFSMPTRSRARQTFVLSNLVISKQCACPKCWI